MWLGVHALDRIESPDPGEHCRAHRQRRSSGRNGSELREIVRPPAARQRRRWAAGSARPSVLAASGHNRTDIAQMLESCPRSRGMSPAAPSCATRTCTARLVGTSPCRRSPSLPETHDPVTPPADAGRDFSHVEFATQRVILLDAAHLANVEQAGAFSMIACSRSFSTKRGRMGHG